MIFQVEIDNELFKKWMFESIREYEIPEEFLRFILADSIGRHTGPLKKGQLKVTRCESIVRKEVE